MVQKKAITSTIPNFYGLRNKSKHKDKAFGIEAIHYVIWKFMQMLKKKNNYAYVY